MLRSQFSKYMCHRNRAVRLSTDDLDCYEKKFHKKIKLRIINYRLHNNSSNEYYRKCLFHEFINNDRGFEKFCDMSIKLLNKHAPIKKKYKRGNQMPFVTEDLPKAIMKRSKH